MRPTLTYHRHGFTLIELSVVLVVIGLLVGGIMSLTSFSRNAELTTTMNEGKYYINAFNQFQQRYNAAPGDYRTASSAWSGAGDGDGNGLIRATAAAPGNQVEWFYTFQHLAMAGFIQGKYTGASTGGGGTYYAKIGTNVPGATAGSTAFLFDNPDFTDGSPDGFISGDATYFDGAYSNVLIIAGLSASATGIPSSGFLNPKQALQLDEKFDDGLPGQGSILTPISTAVPGCATTAVTTTAVYDTSATYANAKNCYFIMRM